MQPLLQLNNISKNFTKGRKLFNGLNLSIQSSEFVCILGPSGCGKSTLLRVLCDLDHDHTGEVLKKPETSFSFVFQESRLIPWLNVKENILIPYSIQKTQAPSPDALAETVGLKSFYNYFPKELSGGLKMRVSVVRALVTRPQALLLDEPFAALDEMTRYKLQIELRNLHEKNNMASVFVTHSFSESAFLADRILVMNKNGEIKDELLVSFHKRDENYRNSEIYFENVKKVKESFYKINGGLIEK